MTSQGFCHKCGVTTHNYFHTPPIETHDGASHRGYWYCSEHGPSYDEQNPNEPRLNREERRRLKKTRLKFMREKQ